ncbi:hypothetical protein [Halalkalibacter lacteus]|uniref:hypothetical protein n=1 Tax=Halalkalibacter lacteus TaxID=3090663 RepID=UPI002FCBD001
MKKVENEKGKTFFVIKIVTAIISILIVMVGVFNNSLNVNILFLLAGFIFSLSVIETYFLKGKDGNFIADTILAIGFLLAFFLI